MTILGKFILVTLLSSGLTMQSGVILEHKASGMQTTEVRTIEPAKIYKHNQLDAISEDGKYLLFFGSRSPSWLYSVDSKGRVKKHHKEDPEQALRVVEFVGGKEIAKQPARGYTRYEQFIQNGDKIFYHDSHSEMYRIWYFKENKITDCIDNSSLSISRIRFINEHIAVGTKHKAASKYEDNLIKLVLPDCKLDIIDDIYPDELKKSGEEYSAFSMISLSPDKRRIAYRTNAGRVAVRDTSTFEVVGDFTQEPLANSSTSPDHFTPDGKYFITLNFPFSDLNKIKKTYYMLIYDAKTFKLVKQIRISGIENFVISPDSRYAAVGYQVGGRETRKVQTVIDLMEIETGRVVANMKFAQLKYKHNNPFRSDINSMFFTPDGKYLLASTYDTYLWDVGEFTEQRKQLIP